MTDALPLLPDERVRRRRWLPIAALVVVVVLAAIVVRVTTFKPPNLTERVIHGATVRLAGPAPAPAWPASGQAAIDVPGLGSLGSSGSDTPRPTASLAKVMTAYLTLKRYPLSGGGGGFTLTVTNEAAQDEAAGLKQDESVVAVRAGERLDERQLLEALLVPSGDNIAQLLAVYDAGTVSRFVDEMNGTARALGMSRTTYTDPSGFDPSTVSVPADQLRLFERAMQFSVFRQIVSMPSVTLPVAGTVSNYDALLSEGYDGKTGSDSEAEGCLVFFKYVTVAGRRLTVVGVVMGQGYGATTSVILAAAGAAAERLASSVTRAIRARIVVPQGAAVISARSPDGHEAVATTSAPLRVIGWGGMQMRLQIRSRALGTDLRAGQLVGSVALHGQPLTPGGSRAQTAVRAVRSLPAPGLFWKLGQIL